MDEENPLGDFALEDLFFKVEEFDKARHDREQFRSGNGALDRYFKRQASQDVKRNLAVVRVMVAEGAPSVVLGFYTLSCWGIDSAILPDELSKKLPSNIGIPVILLGRFAIARSVQGRGLGRQLLADAIQTATNAKHTAAAYALIVDAIDERAEAFYKKAGFSELKKSDRRLFIQINPPAPTASGHLCHTLFCPLG